MPDYLAGLPAAERLASQPLRGTRLGLVASTLDEGVSPPVHEAVHRAARHYESLGADVTTVGAPPS